MSEEYTINTAPETPATLAEQAIAAGIDITDIDPTSNEVRTNLETKPVEKPKKYANKYETPEELEKAYTELQKKLGSQSQEKTETKSAETETKTDTKTDTKASEKTETESNETKTDEQKADETVDAAKEVAEKAGLDFDALSKKYWAPDSKGLEESDYAAIEKAGIPRAIVDQFIEGQQAIVDARVGQMFDEVGGQEAYGEMQNWIATNLTKPEIDSFNNILDGNDFNAIMMAVRGMNARYRADGAREPTVKLTGAAKASGGAFRTDAELKSAMQDPRYFKDAAYREDVQRRAAALIR